MQTNNVHVERLVLVPTQTRIFIFTVLVKLMSAGGNVFAAQGHKSLQSGKRVTFVLRNAVEWTWKWVNL